jgi:hypothetical protein
MPIVIEQVEAEAPRAAPPPPAPAASAADAMKPEDIEALIARHAARLARLQAE